MADIKIVCDGKSDGFRLPNGSALYVDGNKLRHVMSIVPNLTEMDEIATVTITLAVSSFTFGPEAE